MPADARDVITALSRKGFDDRNGDHKFFVLFVSGKKTRIATKISHGEREIHDRNLGFMAKQMELTGPEFRKFIECSMSRPAYASLMRDRGMVE